jgi:predicted nucleotidyltransferase
VEATLIEENAIRKAVELLQKAAPGSSVIVFGSCARGQADEDSDLDVLVIEPEVASSVEEAVRLRDVLSPLQIPVDVLVVSRQTFEYWADTPNTVFNEAVREGRVFDAVP